MEVLKDRSIIRLEGECTVTSAAELKGMLLEGLASGRDLRVDLEQVEDIDITILQLLWAAGHEVAPSGSRMEVSLSEAAKRISDDAGFDLCRK